MNIAIKLGEANAQRASIKLPHMNQEESNELFQSINRIGMHMNKSRKTQSTIFINQSGEHQ